MISEVNWEQFSLDYLNVLRGTFAGLNLTRILDEKEFYQKQILDSLAPLYQSEIFLKQIKEKKLCVDVGFGGGFPLVPLAKALPDIEFVGVEKIRKKIDAVKEICKILNISNIKFIHSNLAGINFSKDAVITLKAVGSLENYLPLFKTSGRLSVFFYKGPSFVNDESKSLERFSGEWKSIEEKTLAVEGVGDRILIGLENRNVLRGTLKNNSENIDIASIL